MRNTLPTSALMLVCIVLFAVSCSSDTTAPIGATDTAYFDERHLRGLMSVDGCEGFRFYTAMRGPDERTFTALVIPLDKAGNEIYRWARGPWYHRFERLEGSTAEYKALMEKAARASVLYVRDAGMEPWSADFTLKEVEYVLEVKDANGLRVDHSSTTKGEKTFLIAPVHIENGVARDVGDENSIVICEQPCPNLCPHRYLHR